MRPEYLAPASRKAILTRVLYNLKNLYYRNGDFGRALTAAERRRDSAAAAKGQAAIALFKSLGGGWS